MHIAGTWHHAPDSQGRQNCDMPPPVKLVAVEPQQHSERAPEQGVAAATVAVAATAGGCTGGPRAAAAAAAARVVAAVYGFSMATGPAAHSNMGSNFTPGGLASAGELSAAAREPEVACTHHRLGHCIGQSQRPSAVRLCLRGRAGAPGKGGWANACVAPGKHSLLHSGGSCA